MTRINLEMFLKVLEDTNRGSSSNVTETTAVNDINIDSLDLFSVIGHFEDATNTSLSDEEFEAMETVADFLAFFST